MPQSKPRGQPSSFWQLCVQKRPPVISMQRPPPQSLSALHGLHRHTLRFEHTPTGPQSALARHSTHWKVVVRQRFRTG